MTGSDGAPQELSDQELVRRARGGDSAAAGLLFERHGAALRARVRRCLPRLLRAKVGESDVVQEACLAAFLHLEEFEDRGEGSFRGWLGAVAERKVLDELRRFAGTNKRNVAREVGGATTAARLAATSGDPSPSAAAIGDEESARLAAAMERLSEEHREVIRLVNEERLPLAEAGARMGRSAEAVRKLYARAVLVLGEHMRGGASASS
jgi:RNA polymerase sigma-70 factor (ECF subfamily)